MKRGFTLIELLIVVAIIAILAAIAVPNFLEAQVRAKVSRSKNDQRSLATAIEAYQVDAGDVPPGPPAVLIYGNVPLCRLTSPVSYIASIPQDVFKEKGGRRGNKADMGTSYEYGAVNNGADKTAKPMPKVINHGYKWVVGGAGPAKFYAFPGIWYLVTGTTNPGAQQETESYDPTNGTVSRGWIVRTNKGIWSGWWE